MAFSLLGLSGVTEYQKQELFYMTRQELGNPVVNVELEDSQIEVAFCKAIREYSHFVNNWALENKMSQMLGLPKEIDFTLKYISNNFSLEKSFANAYSEQVGVGIESSRELKTAAINLTGGTQDYYIEAGREINEVLWFTPSTIDAALFSNYGGLDTGFGGGFSQLGNGMLGNGGYYIAPAYDVLLTAADLNLKNRILRSDLTYKLTAGPEGTRLLHLMSVPGSKMSFAGAGNLGNGLLGVSGCRVWYHYYDIGLSGNTDECRRLNPDIILLPNEVPLSKLDYIKFNEPTKVTIRQLFNAEAKRILALIRGKFSGVIGPQEAEKKMDYEMLLTQSKEERDAVLLELKERLIRLSPESMLTRMANESEQLNKHLKYRPLGWYLK